MPTTGDKGKKWANATQGVEGQIVYESAAETLDFTTGLTQAPLGVLSNRPKVGETAQYANPKDGDTVLVLVDGTVNIAVGDLLKTNATGRGVKAAKNATVVATVAWIIGYAQEACVGVDKLISVRWRPLEGQYV